MRFYLRQYSLSILMSVFVDACLTTTGYAGANRQQPLLVVRIFNQAQVDDDDVENAMKQVEHIYREAGIRTEWRIMTNLQDPDFDPGRLELTIILVSDSFAEAEGLNGSNTGFALGNSGKGARRAYVYTDRARQQAFCALTRREISVGEANALILGNVIAHEAGHLLLPPKSHSQAGIMMPLFDIRSVDQALCGSLLFTKDQSAKIRTVLLNQSGRY
jgi:hypothetical protein